MNKLKKFRNCQSKKDLALILGFSERKFTHILFGHDTSNKYYEFSIPKKSGGQRRILAPNPELKELQTNLAHLLSDCYDDIETERLLNRGREPSIRSFSSHGFRRKLEVKNLPKELRFGIYSNARIHTNKRYVLNIDIQNFFESITFSRILGYFTKNKNFLLDYPVALLITQISTYRPSSEVEGYLPQGSPLSPVISNLIGSILDAQMLNLANRYKLDYSRYADDITLSTNLKDFPLDIAYQNDGKWIVGSKLKKAIESSRFNINRKKTRLYHKNNKQEVTSLTVNKKVNINRDYYRCTRSMVHQYCKTGEFFRSDAHRNDKKSNAKSLSGILSFIYEIKVRENNLNQGFEDSGTGVRNFENLSSIEKLYTSFLFHYNFIYSSRTVVIGEGITDQLHLRVAYKKLFGKNKNFMNSMRFTYLGKLKRFTDFMNFNGGTGLLKHFLKNYHSFFKSEVLSPNPCIILVDNDSAGSGVIAKARNVFSESSKHIKINIGRDIEFYHLHHNLYIVQIKDVKDIEDLYPSDLLHEKIGHRTFEPIYKKSKPNKKDWNNNDFFSKKDFYENVVRKKKNSIDFTGFQPMFENFNYIQLHYFLHKLLFENEKISSLNTL